MGFSWTTASCATLAKLSVYDMHANLRSAVTGVGVGDKNKLLNLSGLVIGAFLQMRMLNIMTPLMHDTWFLLKYPDAGSQMGREKYHKDITGEKHSKVSVVNAWSASWYRDLFARMEEDGAGGCWQC